MWDRWKYFLNRAGERLWVKPLVVCLLSIVAAFAAHLADGTGLGDFVPEITQDSNETLLKIMASSMLVMATFAVSSMVAAYASASSSATPRAFTLVVADDASQNALSAFIGAFIFSVVALVAQMNGYYEKAGLFVLFALTILVLVIVTVTFVRWVDNIARLGRMRNTINRVELAAAAAIKTRLANPRLGGTSAQSPKDGIAVYGNAIGYLQRVDTAQLQALAQSSGLRVFVAEIPGAFCTPDRPLAWVSSDSDSVPSDVDMKALAAAFEIGASRVFDHDPRFGLVVLSEIGSRALSPAVNDPGTAIDVIGTLVRLFSMWDTRGKAQTPPVIKFDRVAVPELNLADLFDDAFTGIARDGAGTVEVVVRLQKALESLAVIDNAPMQESALLHARRSLVRAELAMQAPSDLAAVQKAAEFAAL